jgi:formiminotetrahydrofolate cyclodeaminase
MKRLSSEISIRDFLASVASADEAHGAVSAAAVSGGIGVSLLLMAAVLPSTRSGSVEDRSTLREAAAGLSDVQEQLIEAVETETAVKLFAAQNLPQASETQRAARLAALQVALRAAADVPLEVMRLCAGGLRHAEMVAAHSARAASADVQLGVALLQSAFNGARANLERKLSTLTDPSYITSVVDEIAQLNDETTRVARATEAHLQMPPA